MNGSLQRVLLIFQEVVFFWDLGQQSLSSQRVIILPTRSLGRKFWDRLGLREIEGWDAGRMGASYSSHDT